MEVQTLQSCFDCSINLEKMLFRINRHPSHPHESDRHKTELNKRSTLLFEILYMPSINAPARLLGLCPFF